FLIAMHEQICGWNQKQSYQKRKAQAADEGASERRILLAARLQRQSHGNKSKKCCESRHHDGTEAHVACLFQRFENWESLPPKLTRELHDQNRIRHYNAYHHHD